MIRHASSILLLAGLLASCGGSAPNAPFAQATQSDNSLNLYIWADYLAPDTLSGFEKETGIKVRVAYFDNPETLESRMLMGHSGYDVAVPTAAFIRRQIGSGAYLALDKSRLPNLANLDPTLLARVANNDPGNAHAIVYTWGTFGIGINRQALSKLLPNAPLNSWRLVFDPALAAKAAPCGISFTDDPVGVARLALIFLGRDSNNPSERDFADVEHLLANIRPYVRNIDTSGQIQALANGDLCIAVAYNGNVVQAKRRAKEADSHVDIDYVIPLEGSLLWFDLMTIPKDAPHVANAYRFLNYIMAPRVIANVSNAIGYANANLAAPPFIDAALMQDSAVYPKPDELKHLVTQVEPTQEEARTFTRLWQRFKTGQ